MSTNNCVQNHFGVPLRAQPLSSSRCPWSTCTSRHLRQLPRHVDEHNASGGSINEREVIPEPCKWHDFCTLRKHNLARIKLPRFGVFDEFARHELSFNAQSTRGQLKVPRVEQDVSISVVSISERADSSLIGCNRNKNYTSRSQAR